MAMLWGNLDFVILTNNAYGPLIVPRLLIHESPQINPPSNFVTVSMPLSMTMVIIILSRSCSRGSVRRTRTCRRRMSLTRRRHRHWNSKQRILCILRIIHPILHIRKSIIRVPTPTLLLVICGETGGHTTSWFRQNWLAIGRQIRQCRFLRRRRSRILQRRRTRGRRRRCGPNRLGSNSLPSLARFDNWSR